MNTLKSSAKNGCCAASFDKEQLTTFLFVTGHLMPRGNEIYIY